MRKLASSKRQSTNSHCCSTDLRQLGAREPAVESRGRAAPDASEKSAPARSHRTNSTSTRRACSKLAPANRTPVNRHARDVGVHEAGRGAVALADLHVGELHVGARARGQSSTITTSTTVGPWTPSVVIISRSPVRLGPPIHVSALGSVPANDATASANVRHDVGRADHADVHRRQERDRARHVRSRRPARARPAP